MMMSEIDPKVIKKTQDALGKLIKRPPLTDKLLSRPPFRFIHDICSSLILSTGIMKGLFTAEELNADCIKDKEAKSTFLKKVVDYATAAHNHSLDIKVSSIIAGKEAERTNLLLQLLASAAAKGPSDTCSDVIKDVAFKSGDEVQIQPPTQLFGPCNKAPEVSMDPQSTPNTIEGFAAISPQSRTSRPPSAKGLKKPITAVIGKPNFSIFSSRPSPGQVPTMAPTPDTPAFAEFPKEDLQESMEPVRANAFPSSSVTGIMVENEILSEDEAEDDTRRGGEEEENVSGVRLAHVSGGEGDFSEVEDDGQANGGLVSKLLKTKNELGRESTIHSNGSKQSHLLVVNEVAKKRDREATEREMEKLCQILQNLTRSALPLGKLIDLMQEDFESIQTEYREWKEEEERRQQQIRKAQGQSDPRVAQLREELEQLEKKQLEYRRAIALMKASILNNDKTIEQMLIQATGNS
ncbi:unnamed protein product [Hydatigera taeniaeformis]|uniref:TRAF3-interacting protein 1 n=1 Tax=Hydatigena taeniaeformis TaxID=6205 RepID=A0A0R3WID3_HYDTA|nr:unnamed protein product [Hydatigera taeniaeformis]